MEANGKYNQSCSARLRSHSSNNRHNAEEDQEVQEEGRGGREEAEPRGGEAADDQRAHGEVQHAGGRAAQGLR